MADTELHVRAITIMIEPNRFNLDAVRVPAKYPGKRHFKGPNVGKPSGNPLGKNPSDMWEVLAQDWESAMWDIPNVKMRKSLKSPKNGNQRHKPPS